LLLRRHCCPHAGSWRRHAANATGCFIANADSNGDDCRHTRYTHSHTHRYSLHANALAVYAGSVCNADDAAQRHAYANRNTDGDADRNIVANGDGHAHRGASAYRDLYQRANGNGHVYAYGHANGDDHGRTNRDGDTY